MKTVEGESFMVKTRGGKVMVETHVTMTESLPTTA